MAQEYAKEAILKIADVISSGEVVPVETAHISGVSYLTIGEHGVEFLEFLVSLGAKVSVFTTSNPAATDLGGVLEIDKETLEGQRRIYKALWAMGVSTISSCTPYDFILTRPRTFHAWAESNAITYINTFRDAWSDKNPGPLALLGAIAGFVPKTPLYTLEGRRPTAYVKIDVGPLDSLEAGVVGALIGERLGSGVPYLSGAVFRDEESRREFAAALSTYSSMVFAVVEGVTPHWWEYLHMGDFRDKITISRDDVAKYLGDVETPDAVYIGCPFADPDTILWVLEEVKKRGPAKRPIYISTSPHVYKQLGKLAETASRLNIIIFAGTCLVVSPFTRRFKSIATNSLKAAFYIPKLHEVRVIPCRKEKCIELAYA
ncbi:predicted aconitase subunit 1 [Pyrobaculum islandicum DSM 4184]|uniref:Phosphomevalonate dehydratase large subunit n=1 Tax=Pyrobaculum islandicum (strain DSM 4184 / JCM 9189 / GEO3) TaxID=384616 RepID=A1RSU9_PYRIL|nr:aconitase X [Pyrobaculum islandicum]ABL88031.1 predicted aconitase subunit 1 [Pyrobaculum islandicum DSM 4184]